MMVAGYGVKFVGFGFLPISLSLDTSDTIRLIYLLSPSQDLGPVWSLVFLMLVLHLDKLLCVGGDRKDNAS